MSWNSELFPEILGPESHAVVAFSGGLDTSLCVLLLRREVGCKVTTVTVDTGGFDAQDIEYIEARSRELGAEEHFFIDGRQAVYDDHIAYLIKGNVLRGAVYPLCVGAERVVQGRDVANVAAQQGADVILHGSTGAGNDQVRFEVAIAATRPDIPTWAPIRDLGITRQQSTDYLRACGFVVDDKTTDYSINAGLWGVTIGGKETHDAAAYPPPEAWPSTVAPDDAPAEGASLRLGFVAGLPVSVDGRPLPPLQLLEALRSLGEAHGIGRDIHLGDTILGIKGRIAFEAPAAAILIPAHRELEKLVLSRLQMFHKNQLGDLYGLLLHEAGWFDPVVRDIEAFVDSSQGRVEGEVSVYLRQGHVSVRGVSSPFTMMAPELARYGEEAALWDGRDAAGFAKIFGTQQLLAGLALRRGGKS
jgi:argininosuccinate synthase